MPITLTHKAIAAVKDIIENNSMDQNDSFLKVGVRGGGCSGYTYSMDIVSACNEDDEVWDYDGVRVLCDSRSLLYLEGTVIDYKDEVMQKGFEFQNPNHTRCGCASSFS